MIPYDTENPEESKTKGIYEYLEKHTDLKVFIILDSVEMEQYFRGHTIYTGDAGSFDDCFLENACRILEFCLWWEQRYRKVLPSDLDEGSALIKDYYNKVIFLDVDGVLKDDEPFWGEREREEGYERLYIEPELVKNLRWIVDETGAELVLSSSWRNAYFRDRYDNFKNVHDSLAALFKCLDQYHLRIPGMTPRYFNGPDGSPFEIRVWLSCRPYMERFVILDDDTFWRWNWMEENVVCTRFEVPKLDGKTLVRYIKGLNKDYVKQAVEILGGR